MKVTVKLGAPLSQVVGENKVILHPPEGATITDVFEDLTATYPDFQAGLRGKGMRQPVDHVLYSLFLNSRPVRFDQAESTLLRDGDRIFLFLPVAGGH
ncbi:MoaD/ThiS family protein [Chloroflexota bacterium]